MVRARMAASFFNEGNAVFVFIDAFALALQTDK